MSFEPEFAEAVEAGEGFACPDCHDFICDALDGNHCPTCHEGRCQLCGELIPKGAPHETDPTFNDKYCAPCCAKENA